MSYKVTAPLVIIPNADGKSGDWYGYVNAVVPTGHNDKRCDALVHEGMLEKVKADRQSDPEPDPEFDPAKGGGVKETLTYVGDDKAKATAMLEAEQAKGDKARASLIEKLEAIVTEPSS